MSRALSIINRHPPANFVCVALDCFFWLVFINQVVKLFVNNKISFVWHYYCAFLSYQYPSLKLTDYLLRFIANTRPVRAGRFL